MVAAIQRLKAAQLHRSNPIIQRLNVHPKTWGRFEPNLTDSYFSDGMGDPTTTNQLKLKLIEWSDSWLSEKCWNDRITLPKIKQQTPLKLVNSQMERIIFPLPAFLLRGFLLLVEGSAYSKD